MERYLNPEKSEWPQILERPLFDASELTANVKAILTEIKTDGLSAIKKFTQQFDGAVIDDFAVSAQELSEAANQLDPKLKEAITIAAENIKQFHASQQTEINKVETTKGVVCWHMRPNWRAEVIFTIRRC